MAVWYYGSDQYVAITVWAALETLSVGAIRRQTAPASDATARAFRVSSITTGITGVSEPSWNTSKASTTTDSGVTWTEVTGNSTYGWTTAHKDHVNAFTWAAAGDTFYCSSGHAYSVAGTVSINTNGGGTTEGRILSVNPAGSVPPVAADLLAGGTDTTTGNNSINIDNTAYIYGRYWVAGSGASGTASINVASLSNGSIILDTCKFTIGTTGTSSRVTFGTGSANVPYNITLLNPVFKFGDVGQAINVRDTRFKWIGGSVDGSGSIPTNLFKCVVTPGSQIYVEGADLSALGSNTIVGASGCSDTYTFAGCKLGTNYVFMTASANYGGPRVNVINCSSGANNYINEAHDYLGDMTTEISIVRSGGASDGTTPVSWKFVTSSKTTWAHPFELLRREIWNDTTGSAITLTVETENDGTTAKDSEIWIDVDYMGSSGSPIFTRVSSKSATILTAGNNLTTSGVTWNNTGGQGSPVKQYMQVTFTPEMKGPIYYQVKVAKASFTGYVDPVATLGV